MITHIALTGAIGSGKTTLAKELQQRYGYTLINFTDHLKDLAAACLSPYVYTTVDDIKNNKAKYRGFLQEFGDLIGFTDHPDYIGDVLSPWYLAGQPAAVFDNVRSPQQAKILKNYGFTLVKLDVPREVIEQRNYGRATVQQYGHAIERGLDDGIDLTIAGVGSAEYVAWLLAGGGLEMMEVGGYENVS